MCFFSDQKDKIITSGRITGSPSPPKKAPKTQAWSMKEEFPSEFIPIVKDAGSSSPAKKYLPPQDYNPMPHGPSDNPPNASRSPKKDIPKGGRIGPFSESTTSTTNTTEQGSATKTSDATATTSDSRSNDDPKSGTSTTQSSSSKNDALAKALTKQASRQIVKELVGGKHSISDHYGELGKILPM